jgi:hypothetical protein
MFASQIAFQELRNRDERIRSAFEDISIRDERLREAISRLSGDCPHPAVQQKQQNFEKTNSVRAEQLNHFEIEQKKVIARGIDGPTSANKPSIHRFTKAQAENLVGRHLQINQHQKVTIREVQRATGIPLGTISRTDAWQQRPKKQNGRTRNPRCVPLTDNIVAVRPDNTIMGPVEAATQNELMALIAGHKKDKQIEENFPTRKRRA